MYARLAYNFSALPENKQILYEPGAEDLAKLVAENYKASVGKVEKRQYLPFKDAGAIRIYVFNDRKHYANYRNTSILTRGSSTTNEVYLAEKLRENIARLPSILTHELSHVHIRQYTGTLKYVDDIPGWYHEGVAVYVSSGGGAEKVSAQQAEAALRSKPLFEPGDAGRIIGHKTAHNYGLTPHMYYRQASLFVEYLATVNPQEFKAAFMDLLNGSSFKEVWMQHYKKSISQLWQRYKNSIGA